MSRTRLYKYLDAEGGLKMMNLSRVMNGVYLGVQQLDVQYKDIINKPDFFHKIDIGNFRHS